MTYSKITDYASKDALLSTDPNKIIKGVEIGAEFDALQAEDLLNAKRGAIQAQTYTAFTTTGTGAAYVLTPTPALTALASGQRFRATFHTVCSGTPTLAISGLAAKALKYRDYSGAKQTPTNEHIPTGWSSDVVYDGTDYLVLETPLTDGAENVAYLSAGTGAVATTVQAKLRESRSVWDFAANGVSGAAVDPTGVANSTLGIIAADAAVAAGGGGNLIFPPGTYLFNGDLTPSAGVVWIGVGIRQYAPKLKAADSTARVLMSAGGGLHNFYIEGSVSTPGALVGTGLQIGSTSHAGHIDVSNVFVRYFQTGLRLAAALWTTFTKCQFEYNRVGVDFNAGSASMYSTTVTFNDCVAANNERNGIGATSTPIRNIGIRWIGGSIENNSTVSPATYPQVHFGSVGNFEIDTYIEYTVAGTKPDAINGNGLSQGKISVYINGAENGIRDVSAGMSDVQIAECTFNSITTRNIDCASVTRVVAITNGSDGSAASANVLTGTGCVDMASYKPTVTKATETLYVPTLTGSSGTSAHTYVWQYLYYTQVDGRVHFNGAVRISAKDAGMTGNARISLPIASAVNTVNYAVVNVVCDNVTQAANKNGFSGLIAPNSSVIELWEQSSNAGASSALPSSAISATSIIYFSGSYRVE